MEVEPMNNNSAFNPASLEPEFRSTYYNINRKHKDSLFRLVFKSREDLLDLYNALNNTAYSDTSLLDIYTIDDAIYMNYKNDISFILDNILNLYEHQSTTNPNMPVRGLIYFARNYESYIAVNRLNIYGSVLQKLPLPQFIVFYNGTDNDAEQITLKLSDAFPDIPGKEPCLECTATMLNINYGHNRQLMEHCTKLREYALFIHEIRVSQKTYLNIKDAVDAAIDTCIESHILENILLKHRAEVRNMLLTHFDQEAYEKAIKAEAEDMGVQRGIAIGEERGIAIGEERFMRNVIHDSLSRGRSSAQIADFLNVSIEFVEQLMQK